MVFAFLSCPLANPATLSVWELLPVASQRRPEEEEEKNTTLDIQVPRHN